METKDLILELRKNAGLSQSEFADKLCVTRQAVSRWENGETIPNVDTLKVMAELFSVSVDHLLGHPSGICQSCGMPLQTEDEKGTMEDGSKSEDYCTFCFQNGAFTRNYSLEDAIAHNLEMLGEFNADNGWNLTPEEARAQLLEFLPTLKRWRQ